MLGLYILLWIVSFAVSYFIGYCKVLLNNSFVQIILKTSSISCNGFKPRVTLDCFAAMFEEQLMSLANTKKKINC